MSSRSPSASHSLIAYVGAAVLASGLAGIVLHVWDLNWRIPLGYWGDANAAAVIIKSIIDTGGYVTNPYLGAPGSLHWGDFPMSDGLHLLIVKVLSWFTADYAVALNAFFLLSFPLTAITSLFAFQRLGLQTPFALTASLLYALLPYHFFRGTAHLFLSSYYVVPLVVLVVVRLFDAEPPFFESTGGGGFRPAWRTRKASGYAVVAVTTGSSSIYYAFFACYFFLVAGMSAAAVRRRLAPLISAGSLIALVVTTGLVNATPFFSYTLANGRNPEATERFTGQAERYGLKIAQLVLPVSGHRLGILERVKASYNREAPLVNENNHSTLGVIGSVGFLALIGLLFVRVVESQGTEVLRQLGLLNLAALLLATVGGFGSVVAVTISPMIRSYNRVSVFIAWFSLLAFFLIVQRLLHRVRGLDRLQVVWSLAVSFALLGLYDQTTPRYVPPYEELRARFQNDARFVAEIERAVPPGAMIFQLPYVPFPENPPVHRMPDYELFKGYLHAKTLRWSYGAMKGREVDAWQRTVSGKPIGEFVATIGAAGFAGIYVNRTGYSDGGAAVERELSAVLDSPSVVSPDGVLAFYRLNRAVRPPADSG